MSPKVYIIIPTRNRFDTLKYSIQTCLNQSYENLEVIVSDNASSDETMRIMSYFSDSRLKYQRSEIVLPMLYSWEFALSAVSSDGFVHIMGDDNGLTVDAVSNVVCLLNQTGLMVVLSSAIQYVWPNSNVRYGYLSVPLSKSVYIVDSRYALKSAYNLFVGFDRLPTINSAFIHTSVIDKVKILFGGKYFIASNPDVCSAIANACVVDSYVYCTKPFVINGASVFSNGMQGGSSINKSTFVEDNVNGGYMYHVLFPASKSYYMNVYEAFAVVSDLLRAKGLDFPQLNYSKVYRKFKEVEYSKFGKYWLYDDLLQFAKNVGINEEIYRISESIKIVDPTKGKVRLFDMSSDNITFSSSFISLKNINETALFCREVFIGSIISPKILFKFNIFEWLKRVFVFKVLLRSRSIKSCNF